MPKINRVSRIDFLKLAKILSDAKRLKGITEYKSPGILARVLLDTFIFENGNLTSELFVSEKVCAKGAFTKLRNRLIKDQFLQFREDSLRYFPGIRLKPYVEDLKKAKFASLAQVEELDKKKADRTELKDLDLRKADKSELELTRMELEKTNAKLEESSKRIEGIAIAVAELQAAMLPPDSEMKKEIRARSAHKIESLSCKN